MTPEQIVDEIIHYGAPELQALVDGLCPCLAALPIEALAKLIEKATIALTAKNELAAMKAGVQAVDAATDAAEEAALKS